VEFFAKIKLTPLGRESIPLPLLGFLCWDYAVVMEDDTLKDAIISSVALFLYK